MASAKTEGMTISELLKIKNNPLFFPEPEYIQTFNVFGDIENDSEEFHKHYQQLTLTREEQEQCKPINNCVLELESIFNPNSNSDNDDDKNNDSSSVQNDNSDNYNDSNSDSNSKQYIMLPNFIKEQELKWFSDNNKGIMPKCTHDTNAKFNLRYSGKDAIKLEPYLHTSYIIEPNKKIAQAIFLPLVKIAQLVSIRNKEKLGITARGIQEFELMSRINVPVNMTEEKIINKREIIFTCQPISILPYNRYMVIIEKKVKEQIQIFEAEAKLCESEKIGLVNLYIPIKNHSHIKIPIYNNTEDIIEIPKEITIEYLTTEIKDQLPDIIPDFPQLCEYVDITSQTIYR
ncbi:hypothetical protein G9A89_017424 [Geosiphon pyriformis]|nr:hypothetical protein G9A89_017424 [Geosiphon pyriformis]